MESTQNLSALGKNLFAWNFFSASAIPARQSRHEHFAEPPFYGAAFSRRGRLEKSEQAAPPIGCNGIHYDVIFRYGYCYCKEIDGLHD